MKWFLAFLLSAVSFAQNLPDAPQPQIDPQAKHWDTLWDGRASRTSAEVFKMKTYWAFVGTDLAVSTFDAAMSRAYQGGNCIEGGEGLGPRPSFGQLMVHNLPENAAVAAVGWVWLKARGPRWIMPMMLAYPIQDHLRAGYAWTHC